jgi:hypothetical protein
MYACIKIHLSYTFRVSYHISNRKHQDKSYYDTYYVRSPTCTVASAVKAMPSIAAQFLHAVSSSFSVVY